MRYQLNRIFCLILIPIFANVSGCETPSKPSYSNSARLFGSASTLPRPYYDVVKDGTLRCRYYRVSSHRFVFNKTFGDASPFHCGLAVVTNESGVGAIDKNGDYVINPSSKLSQIRDFIDGVAVAQDAKSKKFGTIDMTGQWIVDPLYRQIFVVFPIPGQGSIDLIPVQKKLGQCGYIDRSGAWVIKPSFKSANPFSDGLAFVRVGNSKAKERSVVINQYGQQVIADKYIEGGPFTQKRAWVVLEGEAKWTLIDKQGNVLTRPIFESPSLFVDGVCTAVMKGEVVVIGVNGKIVGRVRGSDSKRFSESLAAYKDDNNSKWGYVDTNGNVAIAPKYDTAWNFRNGCAMVTRDGATEYIDRSGNVLASPDTHAGQDGEATNSDSQ